MNATTLDEIAVSTILKAIHWREIMTIFYLVRHAEPDWNYYEERNLQSSLRDYVHLTEIGISQAEQVVKDHSYLDECDMIISSPFTRSLQTAAHINRTLALPLRVEYDLRGWLPDKYKAASYKEIMELQEDYRKHKGIHPPGVPKVWESRESVFNRTTNVLMKYQNKAKVIVVSHGMVISILMGLDSEEADTCSVHKYIFRE